MTPPNANSGEQRERGSRPCPICKKMSMVDYYPFCSKRCADVDLNRWLKQSYTIPAVEPPDDFGAGEAGEEGYESEPKTEQ